MEQADIREIERMAETVDDATRQKLVEYLALHARLAELAGTDAVNESFALSVLSIDDMADRREAARISQRMRELSRLVFSKL